MLQSNVLFQNPANNRNPAEKQLNSTALAEGEEITATSLGHPEGVERQKKIHRVPSVEEITATSLGNLTVADSKNKFKKRPKWRISTFCNQTKKPEVAMERISYATYITGRGKEYSFEFKLDAVKAALELGIKPSAKKFKISVNTLRSWVHRHQNDGKKGLEDRRSGPKNIPNKIPQDMEEQIIAIRTRCPCFGPRRIKYFYNIPCSLGAMQRVIRKHGLTRKRRRVYQKRRDLRAVKAKRHNSMAHLQMDLKHLRDIPTYWEQLKPLNLPKYQYTVRDTKSGMLFLGYSEELSELNARTMIDYVISQIKPYLPFPVEELTIQTDNGSEFSGNARRIETNPFVYLIEKMHGAKHVYIRPGHCNANADVESSHYLIEEEFYNLTHFADREDFFRKAESYRAYFNLRRPNFSKGGRTPQVICANDWDSRSSLNVSLIKTIDLDKISGPPSLGGQTIPELADLIE